MTETQTPPPATASPIGNGRLAHGDAPSLAKVTRETRKLPTRLLVHAVQKWGKSSLAAQAPDPIFVCTRGEDGIDTLIDNNQIPPVAHFPGTMQTFGHVKLALHELILQPHDYRTVILDTINGAVQLAQEGLTDAKYSGDFEKFDAFGRGGARLLPSVVELTNLLDRLREKGMGVILLAHSVVRNMKNPEGLDYPRWEPPLLKEVQEHLDRWCDAILFGRFDVTVEAKDAKATRGKASLISQDRYLMTVNHPSYSAGNRFGLPDQIECGDSAATAWGNLMGALKAARQKGG
jgi:hypothetical protein